MKIAHKKLENGITVASDIMDHVETVSVSVLVKTGSKFENIQNNGISHFLEHMAFKGTKTRTARDIAEEFDNIGGYYNAYTSREKTVYYAKVLKKDLEVAVDILSDILQNSTYLSEEIDKEREVILQEIAQTNDSPDDKIFDHFQETSYPNQPLGMSILGSVENVSKFNQDDIKRYVDERYSYENIVISAAGNINQSEYENLIEKSFTNFSTQKSSQSSEANYAGGEFRLEKDLEQVHLVMGFDGCSYHDEDYYTQQVLAIILGGGTSSRLFQEVRENKGLAYGISAFGASYSNTGILGLYSSTTEDKINELIDVTCNEIYKITKGVKVEELKRAKAQVKAGLLMSQESSVSRSEKLGGNLATYGRYLYNNEIIDKIEDIDSDMIVTFLERVFSKKSKPTIASMGKIIKMYDYESILKKLAFG